MKNRVEALRKSVGLSQEKFARMMRVSRQTISAIETGKYNPSLELAFAIADCFGAVNRKESCGGRTCGVSAAQGGGTR